MKKLKEEYYMIHWWDAQAELSVYLHDALKKNTNLALQKTVGQFVRVNKQEVTIMMTKGGDEADIITIPTCQILRIFPMTIQEKKVELKKVKVVSNG